MDRPTFVLVEWRQHTGISADLEVELLAAPLWDGTLRDVDAHSGGRGVQNPSVAVEGSSDGIHNFLSLIRF